MRGYITAPSLDCQASSPPCEKNHNDCLGEDEKLQSIERFTVGRGLQVEVLDAQASVTRAQFNQVAALADYNTAVAMWLQATGRVR